MRRWTQCIDDEVQKSEALKLELDETLNKLDNLHTNFSKVELSLKNLQIEKKNLESKHEKKCIDLKSLKSDHENLQKEFNKSNVKIKTLNKEMREAESEQRKMLKKKQDIIENLTEYKVIKESKEKELKLEEKKLKKKQKSLEKREQKSKVEKELKDKAAKETDENLNETLVQSLHSSTLDSNVPVTISSLVTHWLPHPPEVASLSVNHSSLHSHQVGFTHPSSNTSFIPNRLDLSGTEVPSLEPETQETTDLETVRIELMIRHKAQLLVKRKIDNKLKDFEIEGKALADLEQEFLDDLEDTIVEQIEVYKQYLLMHVQPSSEEIEFEDDTYETRGFYWGGEDCCEMIPFEEN